EKVNETSYDLLLIDMHMPKMSGYEAVAVVREIEKKKSLPPIPIIALTAHALREDGAKSIKAGCDRHLTKPITRESLTRAIRETVQTSQDREFDENVVYIKKDLAPLIPNFLENRKKEMS